VTVRNSSQLSSLLPHIIALWQQVLPASRAEVDTHFFLDGGDSLQLTRLLLRVHQHLGVELRLQDLPHYSTPGKMARWCASLGASVATPVQPPATEVTSAAKEFVANSSQQGLWWSEQQSRVGNLYNSGVVIALHGPLQPDVLSAAVAALQQQFSLLTMALQLDVGRRQLLVRRASTPPRSEEPGALSVVGLSIIDLPVADLPLFAASWAAEPFDLACTLFRCRLVRHDASHHSLLLCGHHCVLDGWSGMVLLQQVALNYQALFTNRSWQPPVVDTAFATHCHRQQQRFASDLHQRQLVWWQQYLGSASSLSADLPWQPRAQQWPYRLQRLQYQLPEPLIPRLQELCAASQCTLFAVLATALALALRRIGNNVALPIGFPVAGRANVAEEQSVGCYMQLLPLLLDADDSQPLPMQLAYLHESIQQVLSHAIPLPELVRALRPPVLADGNAWFDIVLALQNFPVAQCDWSPLAASWQVLPATHGQYLLKFEVAGACINVEYAADVVPATDINTLVEWMEGALQKLVDAL